MPRFSFTAPWECVFDAYRDWGAAKLDPEIAGNSPTAIANTWNFVIVIFVTLGSCMDVFFRATATLAERDRIEQRCGRAHKPLPKPREAPANARKRPRCATPTPAWTADMPASLGLTIGLTW
jgi:hypothetical protein